MFGTTQLRSTFHLPAKAPRWSTPFARQASSEVAAAAGLIRRAEHTLAAEAATGRVGGIDLAHPLSVSSDPTRGVLRLEFAAAPAARERAGREALTHHLAALLGLEGVTRVEARLVDPATGTTFDHASIEAPTHP